MWRLHICVIEAYLILNKGGGSQLETRFFFGIVKTHLLIIIVCIFNLKNLVHVASVCQAIVVPTVSKLCPEAVVDCVGKLRIFIQCSRLIAPPRSYESALFRTRVLLPNAGRKVADWLLRGFIQCGNIQVIIARSITASVQKFGGCGYDDASSRYFYKMKNITLCQHSIWQQFINELISNANMGLWTYHWVHNDSKL